jgi:hypothetical protein
MITIKLTEQELGALTGLMDLGVKAGGLQVAGSAAHLLQKMEAAVKEAKEAEQAKSNVIELDKKDAG